MITYLENLEHFVKWQFIKNSLPRADVINKFQRGIALLK